MAPKVTAALRTSPRTSFFSCQRRDLDVCRQKIESCLQSENLIKIRYWRSHLYQLQLQPLQCNLTCKFLLKNWFSMIYWHCRSCFRSLVSLNTRACHYRRRAKVETFRSKMVTSRQQWNFDFVKLFFLVCTCIRVPDVILQSSPLRSGLWIDLIEHAIKHNNLLNLRCLF